MKLRYEVLTTYNMYDKYVDSDDGEYCFKKLDALCFEFKYLDFKYENDNDNYLLLYDKDTLVGISKLKLGGKECLMNPTYNNWIGFVSVSRNHWGKGYSKPLIESIFDYCDKNNINTLLQSMYSDMGWKRIKKQFVKIAKQYPNIDFKDTERHD
jgi:GNAT superfamily N-acetyltransferase